MTATELQTRVEKAQNLPVMFAALGIFYVESEEGKVCYRVEFEEDRISCTCADYAKNGRHDKEFKCKHILAVLNSDSDDIAKIHYLEHHKPRLADRWIMNLKGKDFVLYAGLLDLAHQKGLLKLEVEAIQYPSKENGNTAICKATATSRLGEIFMDVGDADPGNTNSMIAKHILRMASTRAKARVLRDFANIGMTALEELGDFDEVIGEQNTAKKVVGKKATVTPIKPTENKTAAESKPAKESKPTSKAPAKPKTEEKPEETVSDIRPMMSEAQKKAIVNLAKRRGISEDELNQLANENYQKDFASLGPADASQFIRQLQQSA